MIIRRIRIDSGIFIIYLRVIDKWKVSVFVFCVNGFNGTVVINGGNFVGAEAESIILGNVQVAGGTFNYPVDAQYCAEGYMPAYLGKGIYGVKPIE